MSGAVKRAVNLAVIAVFGFGWLGAIAQSSNTPPVSDAVVARLSLISGNVSTQRADTAEWQSGAINTPLVSGDKVAAGPGSRAEVQIDYADLLRLGDNAQANLVSLTRNQIQIQLASGLADYVVLRNPRATSEIDTPNVAIRPRGQGVFRILVNSASETQVIVRRGEADISTPQGSTTLRAGQLITVEGVNSPEYKISDAPGRDSWDRWNSRLDAKVEDAANFQYVNPYYTGAQDLSAYGYWTYVPGYGEVWAPYNQNAGWTPYSHGRWDWEPYWGWTWQDYEPWGWAPYHYGRWFPYGSVWVWWPGPVTPYYRPIWAPAYVSFFGWGGGFGVGVGFGYGSIGWLPIGPCDPFRPWWGGYGFHAVNIYNIRDYGRYGRVVPPLAVAGRGRIAYSNLDGLESNARLRRAVVRIPANQFQHGVIGTRERVTVANIRQGQALGGRLPVVPGRGALGGGRPLARSVVARPVATRFFGRARGAATPSFQQEQARIQTRVRTFSPAAAGRVTAPRGTMRPAAPASRPGFQRFGGPAANARIPGRTFAAPNAGRTFAAPRGTLRPAPATRPGFQRFNRGGQPPVNGRTFAAPRGTMRPAAPATRPGFQRFQPQPQQPQQYGGARSYGGGRPYAGGGSPAYGGYRSYGGGGGRPPLHIGQTIVTPRASSGPRYSAPRGNGGFRSYGGGRPSGGQPHYSAPPRGSFGGGHVSAPHGGGGGVPHGGGGPRGGGGRGGRGGRGH